jgi:hypothetical protein
MGCCPDRTCGQRVPLGPDDDAKEAVAALSEAYATTMVLILRISPQSPTWFTP